MKTRRQLIAASAASLLLGVKTAEAAGSPMSKAAVGYRDIPYNGQVCAQCVYFIFRPSENGTLESRCKMVAGPINPAGWCEIFAPKSASEG
jgi:hypothetical protein